VFGVVGGDVFDCAELVDAAANFVCQGHGGEDGNGAILEADWNGEEVC
jgi:hypothetical protein